MMLGFVDGVDPGWAHYSGFGERSHVGDDARPRRLAYRKTLAFQQLEAFLPL